MLELSAGLWRGGVQVGGPPQISSARRQDFMLELSWGWPKEL